MIIKIVKDKNLRWNIFCEGRSLVPYNNGRFLFSKKKFKPCFYTVQVRNRCVFTGRSRGILAFFKISRIVFKDFVKKEILPHVYKKSW